MEGDLEIVIVRGECRDGWDAFRDAVATFVAAAGGKLKNPGLFFLMIWMNLQDIGPSTAGLR